MILSRLLQGVARKWWLVAALTVIFGIAGYIFNIYMSVTLYSADMTLYVLNRDKVLAGETLNASDINMSQELLTQYAGIFYSRSVASDAAKALASYNISTEELTDMVSISNSENSSIFTITAISSVPGLSVDAANAMGNSFTSQIRELTKNDFIGVLDQAQNSIPISDKGILKTIIWAFVGALLALSIIYVIEYFDTTIRSAEEVEDELRLRVIGIIPEHEIS